jgi:hypothetical protein
MPKRTRENSLDIRWSARERDIVYRHPTHKADGHLLHYVFDVPRKREDGTYDDPVWKQLEDRGYDLTTVRFSICKKTETSSTERRAREGAREGEDV